jgi:hypothetical protein
MIRPDNIWSRHLGPHTFAAMADQREGRQPGLKHPRECREEQEENLAKVASHPQTLVFESQGFAPREA